jgi:DNA-binding transcriptional LysR family regulator
MANVRVQTPTADLLVNQMRAGSLDVAIVYEANTSQVRDSLDVVPIALAEAKAVQPYGVRVHSEHRYLMERLLAAIRSADSRRRFESAGFHWLSEEN